MFGLKGHFEKVDINYRHSHAEAAEDGGTRALNRGGWLGGNNAATVRERKKRRVRPYVFASSYLNKRLERQSNGA